MKQLSKKCLVLVLLGIAAMAVMASCRKERIEVSSLYRTEWYTEDYSCHIFFTGSTGNGVIQLRNEDGSVSSYFGKAYLERRNIVIAMMLYNGWTGNMTGTIDNDVMTLYLNEEKYVFYNCKLGEN